MIEIKYINTMNDFFQMIMNQQYEEDIHRHRSSCFYRGLPNIDYKLVTSLERNCKHKKDILEKSILRNFTKYAVNEDPQLDDSIWRQMIIGQHHGLPTRLLDWTYSPLMAIHFATSGEDMTQMDQHDCVVWKIDIKEMNALLPDKYKDKLKEESAYLFTLKMLDELKINIDTYDKDMNDHAMLLIEPPSIDQRIINQYSYFSIIPSGIKDIETFFEHSCITATKYIIHKSIKWNIRDLLDQMNINERIAYPGLDGLTAWMKRHYYVKDE